MFYFCRKFVPFCDEQAIPKKYTNNFNYNDIQISVLNYIFVNQRLNLSDLETLRKKGFMLNFFNRKREFILSSFLNTQCLCGVAKIPFLETYARRFH